MKQSFFLWGQCLGSREVGEFWYPSNRVLPPGAAFRHINMAYCCPVCSEIWGRVLYEKAMPLWQFTARNCPKHSAPGPKREGWIEWARGSFIANCPNVLDPLNFADDWPEGVVRHEFKLLIEKDVLTVEKE